MRMREHSLFHQLIMRVLLRGLPPQTFLSLGRLSPAHLGKRQKGNHEERVVHSHLLVHPCKWIIGKLTVGYSVLNFPFNLNFNHFCVIISTTSIEKRCSIMCLIFLNFMVWSWTSSQLVIFKASSRGGGLAYQTSSLLLWKKPIKW